MTPCWPFPGPQQQLRAFASAFGHPGLPGLPGPDWRLMAGVRAHAAEQWALHARIFPSASSSHLPSSTASTTAVNPSPGTPNSTTTNPGAGLPLPALWVQHSQNIAFLLRTLLENLQSNSWLSAESLIDCDRSSWVQENLLWKATSRLERDKKDKMSQNLLSCCWWLR